MKTVKPAYAPEFALVLACLRWPQATVDGARILSLAQQPIHWPFLLEIVHHHKVAPLFFRNLETFAGEHVPEETAAALRVSTEANARSCLRRSSHLQLLNRLFREQGIDVRIFKGLPLSMTAFQDPTLRDLGDIDLLVAEKDIFGAGDILRAQGYRRFEPRAHLTPRRLRSYIAHQKDFSYEHPAAGVVIDLHWRLFRNRFLPANAGLDEVGIDCVVVDSERIPTLPVSRLLLYLCVHGALDGWLRLKWLADIGALLRGMTAEQLASTAEAAAKQQALPELSAAIFLCQDMLGDDGDSFPMPAGCLERSDKRVARIVDFGKRLMTSNQYRPVREQISSARWFVNEFRLHSSWSYRVDLIQRSLFRPRVWRKFSLPDALFPLYALLSPLEWFHDRLQKLKRSSRSPADLALVIEAGCMLIFFRIVLNFLPVQKLTTWMSRPGTAQVAVSPGMAAEILRRIEWSIDAVVRHAPLTFVCFPQCLAAYFMLRRRHIASKLFYGVTRDADHLKAHTWVKVGDRTVVGGDVESRFTVLTTFP
jgi:Uncharacterised nucleotidyltransferase/Transglutaminase-like superfamily